MPKSKMWCNAAGPVAKLHTLKPGATATFDSPPLGHLYDAAFHAFNVITTKITLPHELLPRVLSHLDPEEDLETLRIVQQSSSYGWRCATPCIYRDISVINWSKFLRLPDGVRIPLRDSSRQSEHIHQPPPQARSLIRRWVSCRFVKQMTLHSFPTYAEYSIRFLDWTASDDRYGTGGERREKLFPNLEHLVISDRAMAPLCPGGRYANTYVTGQDDDLVNPYEPSVRIITANATPTSGSIILPIMETHNMAYRLGMQFRNGQNDLDSFHTLQPESHLLSSLLTIFACGATITIQNMTDLWLRYTCGHRSQKFHIIYPSLGPNTFRISPHAVHALLEYRAKTYDKLLRCEHKGPSPAIGPPRSQADLKATSANGEALPRSTWTITGEGYSAAHYWHDPCYTSATVKKLCELLMMEYRGREMSLNTSRVVEDEEEGIGAKLDHSKLICHITRMKFIGSGEQSNGEHIAECGE